MGSNIDLTPQLEAFVRAKVDSGLYPSASDVVCDALRLLDERDCFQQMKLKALRRDIGRGLDSGKSEPWNLTALKQEARAQRFSKSTTP